MAERRMFAKTIVLSDAFLDMPMGSRCLYMTLGMIADDDGFVNSPKSVMRQCGATEDDLRVLLAKKFLIAFDSGVIVIKHWRINNYLRNDRYCETKYIEEKATLDVDKNTGAYVQNDDYGIPRYTQYRDTQDRLGKDRLGKDIYNRVTNKFVPPSYEEVQAEILAKGYNIDAEQFIAFYDSKGWFVGKNKMKNWKSALVTWAKRNQPKPSQDIDPQTINPVYDDSINCSLTEEELKELEELMKGRTNETN